MKRLIFLSLLCFSFGSYSEVFKINGEVVNFEEHPSGLLIKNCKKNCEVLKVLSLPQFDPKKIKTKSSMAASLGSTACHYILDGVSILGANLDNDGRDFCIFKDESMVEINSLSRYLEKNKVKK